MRTVPFFNVWKGVVERHGLDPEERIPYQTARAITRGINRRTRMAWRAWDWPDFSITEERAYRQVWNNSHQYYRSNPNTGLPDDVFFIPNATYYTVNTAATQDPPIGTPPVNLGPPPTFPSDPGNHPYFIATAPLDPYVSMDQICQRSIGRVIGIYKSNPRLDGFKHSGITFRITENGIDLFQISGPTIFVKYLPAPSKFTKIPWVSRSYAIGELVFFDSTGETYLSIVANNTQTPTTVAAWRLMPMPEVLAPYVEAGAYADSMRESHPVDQPIAQSAQQAALLADQEAKDLLQFEIDVFMAMGQRHSYNQHRPPRRWIRNGLVTTPAWQAGSVTTLTDVCKTDGMYPSVPGGGAGTTGIAWQWHPEIVSLRGPALPSLAGLFTSGMNVGSKMELSISGAGKEYELIAGTADPLDPGHVVPNDYNLATNNKHWEQVA